MIKKVKRFSLILFLLPVLYGITSLAMTYITVGPTVDKTDKNKTVFIHTNGVHLDFIISKEDLNQKVVHSLNCAEDELYVSIGWGDRDFYLNTPNWGDLTFNNAFKAMFLKSSTLLHVTRFKRVEEDWVAVKLTNSQLDRLNKYISESFVYNQENSAILLKGKGYGVNDDFYEAVGSYSCFNTCNTWVNKALKKSDLESCLWTPFDFRIMDIYKTKELSQ